MKSFNVLSILLLPALLILASCAEQTALTKENSESGGSADALYMEKQETGADTSVRHKILIVPFEYRASKTEYPNPGIYKMIFFTSFYNLFSILPSIDIPDKSVLLNIDASPGNIAILAGQSKCDFIVFGDYSLGGGKSKPDAAVRLMVWDKISGSVTTNSLTTPTDADLFDAIDTLQSGLVTSILKEEMKTAFLNFGSFYTGGEKLALFINHRLVAEPAANDFKLNLKIISGKDYNITVRRFDDGKLLASATENLKPGESVNISATNYRANIIDNSGFEPGTLNKTWFNYDNNLKLSFGNGECHIFVNSTGKTINPWDIQLIAPSLSVKSSKKYRISFSARASGKEDIYINIGMSKPPYPSYLFPPGPMSNYYRYKYEKLQRLF